VEEKKLILISNDDGIDARGLSYLIEMAKPFGNIVVVAPATGQSGMSHSISSRSPLGLQVLEKNNELTIYSITGTPVDCVKLAVNSLLPKIPDIMLSGINHGSNAAINVIYSGTMGAAIEASFHGIRSIGFSVDDHSKNADFSLVMEYGPKLIEQVIKNGLPDQVSLNVNFPVVEPKDFKGYKICKQTKGVWKEGFDKRFDPFGREYYWYTGKFYNFEPNDDCTDEWAIKNNYAAVVPVKIDFTDYNLIDKLKNWKL
jgi:5'-nucleotidase